MKTLLVASFLTFSVTLIAQKSDEPYKFIIRPGTEEWKKLTTSKQMDEACLIPDSIIENMSTEALFITCMTYPRLIDAFMASNLQAGYEFISTHFGGLEELVRRSDLDQVLFKTYLDIDLKNPRIKKYALSLNNFHISFIELLIAQDHVIKRLDREKRELLLAEAISKLELKRLIDESLYHQKTTAFIISRLLAADDKNLSEINKEGVDIFEVFNSHVILTDSTVIVKLLIKSKMELLK